MDVWFATRVDNLGIRVGRLSPEKIDIVIELINRSSEWSRESRPDGHA